MKTLKFLTDIPDEDAVEKIKPHLNSVKGIIEWDVDTTFPGKILTIKVKDLSPADVAPVIFNAGFKSELLDKGFKKKVKKLFKKNAAAKKFRRQQTNPFSLYAVSNFSPLIPDHL